MAQPLLRDVIPFIRHAEETCKYETTSLGSGFSLGLEHGDLLSISEVRDPYESHRYVVVGQGAEKEAHGLWEVEAGRHLIPKSVAARVENPPHFYRMVPWEEERLKVELDPVAHSALILRLTGGRPVSEVRRIWWQQFEEIDEDKRANRFTDEDYDYLFSHLFDEEGEIFYSMTDKELSEGVVMIAGENGLPDRVLSGLTPDEYL